MKPVHNTESRLGLAAIALVQLLALGACGGNPTNPSPVQLSDFPLVSGEACGGFGTGVTDTGLYMILGLGDRVLDPNASQLQATMRVGESAVIDLGRMAARSIPHGRRGLPQPIRRSPSWSPNCRMDIPSRPIRWILSPAPWIQVGWFPYWSASKVVGGTGRRERLSKARPPKGQMLLSGGLRVYNGGTLEAAPAPLLAPVPALSRPE